MNISLPLDRMTTADKLRALDEIWADLSRGAHELTSPAWHEDVLRAREQRVADGSSTFVDWDTAKAAIGVSLQ